MNEAKPRMKSLDDIKLDMSELYDQVKLGTVEIKTAAELANIAGKYLKAEQLGLAREMFLKDIGRRPEQPMLPSPGNGGTDSEPPREAASH
jgi:hypothetical protein